MHPLPLLPNPTPPFELTWACLCTPQQSQNTSHPRCCKVSYSTEPKIGPFRASWSWFGIAWYAFQNGRTLPWHLYPINPCTNQSLHIAHTLPISPSPSATHSTHHSFVPLFETTLMDDIGTNHLQDGS